MFTLEQVVPWGRSFDEYCNMFALSSDDLALRILGCGDGPASFPPAIREPGCPFPMALVRLHNRIDTILQTEAWIGEALHQYGRCSNDWAR